MKRDVLMCADDNLLIYDTTLSDKEITDWAKIAGLEPHDIFPVTIEELQFYIIDDRMQMSEKKDKDVRDLLKMNE